MSTFTSDKNGEILTELGRSINCQSLRQISLKIGVSEWQLSRLKYGLLNKMSLETVLKIAKGFNISINELIVLFSDNEDLLVTVAENKSLAKEYEKLQLKYQQQETQITEKCRLSVLETLESLFLQLPTVINSAEKNPELPAKSVLGLFKPLQRLLEKWDVKAIASVGDVVPYNPLKHQLMEGDANEGDLVEIRYVGYKKGDTLLYRAKVSPAEVLAAV